MERAREGNLIHGVDRARRRREAATTSPSRWTTLLTQALRGIVARVRGAVLRHPTTHAKSAPCMAARSIARDGNAQRDRVDLGRRQFYHALYAGNREGGASSRHDLRAERTADPQAMSILEATSRPYCARPVTISFASTTGTRFR
jgi:hypothetical protein